MPFSIYEPYADGTFPKPKYRAKTMSEVDRTREDVAQDVRLTALENDIGQLRVIINQLLVTVAPLQELEERVKHILSVLGGVKANE